MDPVEYSRFFKIIYNINSTKTVYRVPPSSPIVLCRPYGRLNKQMDVVVTPVVDQVPLDEGGMPWKSCCFMCDKRVIVFASQLMISTTVLMFCMGQLYTSQSCEHDALYSSVLTLVLGCWLPSPTRSLGKKD